MDKRTRILWIDDEVSILKPHILFLEQKDYHVSTASNGNDALELLKKEDFDIIFLDENMPGLTGLETLVGIKDLKPSIPVVMITKSEEESIMEDAIGSKISDYLIKPVNPNQILLSLKKNLEDKKLIQKKTTSNYQSEFTRLGMEISPSLSWKEWIQLYKKIVYWELELDNSGDNGMSDILINQKDEANRVFSKMFTKNYIGWLNDKDDNKPLFSHTLLREKLLPLLQTEEKVFLIVIDNLRLDQWKVIQPVISDQFRVQSDDLFFSILPTATQYARNSLFSGLLPTELKKLYPQFWTDEDEESSKNQFESELLGEFLKRRGVNIKYNYSKILNLRAGRKYADSVKSLKNNKLNVLVYNFVDMLSHSKTNMEVIKELASDESAYRSITRSWFDHSPLAEVFSHVADMGATVLLTTDHGSIRVKNPVKILGDKQTNSNIRFKFGKNLNSASKHVFDVRNPEDIFMPKPNISTSYMFCQADDYFVYPNNYNYYVNFFADSFQHGGISMEEIIIPAITLVPR
ncbi:MAG: bifunctional response regulator/alkaline phosphatase family protein [Bacteroidales bacterium]|nr:bifunctional response regulator/alkaline phosphatase family protein [Bacteroidales bacterium]